MLVSKEVEIGGKVLSLETGRRPLPPENFRVDLSNAKEDPPKRKF